MASTITIDLLFKKRDRISSNIAQYQLKIRELQKIRREVDSTILEAARRTGISNEKIEKLDKSKTKRISAKKKDEIAVKTMKILGVKEPILIMKEIAKRVDEERTGEKFEKE